MGAVGDVCFGVGLTVVGFSLVVWPVRAIDSSCSSSQTGNDVLPGYVFASLTVVLQQ